MARTAADHIRVAIPATLLLLAGGQSRRMGRSKALLPVQETTLLEWLAERLHEDFDQLLVAARDASQLPPALRQRFVADHRPGSGPMAGIEAGLAAARHQTVVAVACDMPYVTGALLRRLAAAAEGHDAAVPRVRGLLQPACAAYRRRALPAISAALEGGERKASEVIRRLEVSWLDGEQPELFANLNTPSEYRAFLAWSRKTR
jgi:molybdopterin-guanine dinucleotide biosynthesis protein A